LSSTVQLRPDTLGGAWSSSNSSVASVDVTTGLLTCVSAGTTTISYTYGSSIASRVVTVDPQTGPGPITGDLEICHNGDTSQLSCLPAGGTWWSNPSYAPSVSSTGALTTNTGGMNLIQYTDSNGCATTTWAIGHAAPGEAKAYSVCVGSSIEYPAPVYGTSTPATGGTWSSSDPLIASIDASSGILTGISEGTVYITYLTTDGCIVSTSKSSGKPATNVSALPVITGTTDICLGGITTLASTTSPGLGSTWTTSASSVATVNVLIPANSADVYGISLGTATIKYIITDTTNSYCETTVNVTVSDPTDITGDLEVCVGQSTSLTSGAEGGTWSSGNTDIATVGSSGIVNGISPGTVTISYSMSGGCFGNVVVTVNALPAAIEGSLTVCTGLTTNLSTATEGGTWSSSNASIATVNVSGVVTGVAAGTANISYTLSTGCYRYVTVTVNASPADITGTFTVSCTSTTTLADATSGGTWSSNNTAVATVGSTGIVTGVSPGTAVISYILSTGCYATAAVTVSSPVINGTPNLCIGGTITLTGSPSGGTWGSSNISVATIGSTSGLVTAISAGTTTITYTKNVSCYSTKQVNVGATFTPTVCQRAPISICDDTLAYCEGFVLAATGAGTGGTYSWSPTLPATQTSEGDSVAVFTFTSAPTTGTYTLTSTNAGGCSIKKTVMIIDAGSGCRPCSFFTVCDPSFEGGDAQRPFTTIKASILSSGNVSTTAPGYYFIAGSATDVTVTLNVSPAPGSVFFMGQNVTLKVVNTSGITLDSNHFFSSPGCPWDGISILNSSSVVGKLKVTGNTLIENTSVAGVSIVGASPTSYLPVSGNIFESDKATFNLNPNGVYINTFRLNTPGAYPFVVKSSVFTARYFCLYHADVDGPAWSGYYPFSWPSATYLKTPVSSEAGLDPAFNIDNFAAQSNSTAGGISLNNSGHTDSVDCDTFTYYGMDFGDSAVVGNTNMFDTLRVGIGVVNANVRIFNSIFRHTTGTTAGVGVYGAQNYVGSGGNDPGNVGKKRTIELLHGYQERTNNRFYNCYSGVMGVCWFSLVCRKTEMSSTIYYGGSVAATMTYGIRNGASSTNRYFGRFILEDNVIRNLKRGIDLTLHSCYSNNACGKVVITGNSVSDNNAYSNSGMGGYGINISDFGGCSSQGAPLTIAANTVEGFEKGIYVFGVSPTYSNFKTNILSNTVILTQESGAGTFTRTGIFVERAKFVKSVSYNHSYGDVSKGFSYSSPATTITPDGHVGIQVELSSDSTGTKTNVGCNYVHDLIAGFRFIDANTVNWHNNVMARHVYGMILHTSGVIGDQTDTCNPGDNIWLDDGSTAGSWPSTAWATTGIFQTYSYASNPTSSKLYVRNVTSGSHLLKPVYNGVASGTTPTGTAYSVGSTILDASTFGCAGTMDTCGPYFASGAERHGIRLEDKGDQSYISQQNGYVVFPNPGDGNLTFKQQIAEDMTVSIRVMNYAGALIHSGTLTFVGGVSSMNLGDVAPGLYVILLSGNTGEPSVFRIVVQ